MVTWHSTSCINRAIGWSQLFMRRPHLPAQLYNTPDHTAITELPHRVTQASPGNSIWDLGFKFPGVLMPLLMALSKKKRSHTSMLGGLLGTALVPSGYSCTVSNYNHKLKWMNYTQFSLKYINIKY